MKNTTLCYIERDSKYLMLHRTKKQNDLNHDKYIGIGGHVEEGESPYDCIKREIFEETGFTLTSELKYRGIVTFVSDECEGEYMHLFKAVGIQGEPHECDEGVLEWVPKSKLYELQMWEGDRIFLSLLDTDCPFFSLKLNYKGDTLISHTLDFAGKEPVMVSACLLGVSCRYDGKSKPLDIDKLIKLRDEYTLIPICPEQLGGLQTPRPPCEIFNDKVMRNDGHDCTEAYYKGAYETLKLAKLLGIKKAILKSKSPSCGKNIIYDGSFTGQLTNGNGITADLLIENGVEVVTENEV